MSGRRKQQEVTVSAAPRIAETLQYSTAVPGEAAPHLMPALTLVAFSTDQISPPYPGPGTISQQSIALSTISTSSSVVQATQCPVPSAHAHHQDVASQIKYSSASSSTGNGKQSDMTSPGFGAVDLSPTGTVSRPQQPDMTSQLPTTVQASLPVIMLCDLHQ